MDKLTAVTPEDIFTYVVQHDEYDAHTLLKNTYNVTSRIKDNIFTGVWSIYYQVLVTANKYRIPLTYELTQQLLLNNIDTLLQEDHSVVDDLNVSGDKLSPVEEQQLVVDTLLQLYDDLLNQEAESGMLAGNMEVYIQTWAQNAYQLALENSNLMLSREVTIGHKKYYGYNDSKNYLKQATSYIDDIVNNDSGKLSEVIDTGIDDYESLMKKMDEDSIGADVASLGLDTFDSEVGMLHKGEVMVIQAGSGVGKTRFSNNLMYNAMTKMGSNVLYLSLEQKSTAIFAMLAARRIAEDAPDLNNMSDKEIREKSYDPDKGYLVSEAYEDILTNPEYGRVRIEGLSLNTSDVLNLLEKTWDDGFHFDVVVLDYIGLVGSESGSGDRYAGVAETINMIKSQCKYFRGEGFLAVVPNQLSKEAEESLRAGKSDNSKTAGASSQDIARASDYIVTLYQTPIDDKNDLISFKTDKVRLGHKIPEKKLSARLGKMIFEEIEEDNSDIEGGL